MPASFTFLAAGNYMIEDDGIPGNEFADTIFGNNGLNMLSGGGGNGTRTWLRARGTSW